MEFLQEALETARQGICLPADFIIIEVKTPYDCNLPYQQTAGDIIKEAYYCAKSPEFKQDNAADLVTATDKLVEKTVFERLKSSFPTHRFVGEEGTGKDDDQALSSSSPYCWVVDPVDGTTNFVHGIPFVCVSIGLCEYGVPILGVVLNPILGETYHAVKGHGSFLNNVRITSSCSSSQRLRPFPASLDSVLVATEYGSDRTPDIMTSKLTSITHIAPLVRGIRSLGSAAMQMCMVARGAFDVYYEAGIHVWDICAGVVIVRESGGMAVGYDDDVIDLCGRKVIAVRPCDDGGEVRAVGLIRNHLAPIEMIRDECEL